VALPATRGPVLPMPGSTVLCGCRAGGAGHDRCMSRSGRIVRIAALLVLAAVMIVALVRVGIPGRQQLRAEVGGWGWWGPVAFVGLYGLVSLSPLPKTVFTLTAGALFGVAAGVGIVVTGAMLGAVAAFGVGRWLGRDAVRRLAGRRVGALDVRLGRRGLWAVMFLRLVPVVPFTAVNYLAGCTSVRLRDFLLGTVIGIVPATTAYVTVGAYGWQPGAWPVWAALAALVVLTVGGLVVERQRRRSRRESPTSVPTSREDAAAAPDRGRRD
jgi:uncharacterized membrane protein YdjX (TVP38/TMEM64 family)